MKQVRFPYCGCIFLWVRFFLDWYIVYQRTGNNIGLYFNRLDITSYVYRRHLRERFRGVANTPRRVMVGIHWLAVLLICPVHRGLFIKWCLVRIHGVLYVFCHVLSAVVGQGRTCSLALSPRRVRAHCTVLFSTFPWSDLSNLPCTVSIYSPLCLPSQCLLT